MFLVLDGRSLTEVVSAEKSELRDAILEICDSIVITDHILGEYSHDKAWSNVQPDLEEFGDQNPSKVHRANPAPVVPYGVPKHHRRLVQDALGMRANYLITHGQELLGLADSLRRQYNLRVVTPGEYIAERTPKP